MYLIQHSDSALITPSIRTLHIECHYAECQYAEYHYAERKGFQKPETDLYQADRRSSQKCEREGKPTILSGKFFQTLKANSISSVLRLASSSNDRIADVVRNLFGRNLEENRPL
jgi:hypothetical protein